MLNQEIQPCSQATGYSCVRFVGAVILNTKVVLSLKLAPLNGSLNFNGEMSVGQVLKLELLFDSRIFSGSN